VVGDLRKVYGVLMYGYWYIVLRRGARSMFAAASAEEAKMDDLRAWLAVVLRHVAMVCRFVTHNRKAS